MPYPYQNTYGQYQYTYGQQYPSVYGQQYPNVYQQNTYQQNTQQYQPLNAIKVDGQAEAMNRFLMHYPANVLVPGFVSDPIFDVNGNQFYTLSIEHDGRRNLETFDFSPHVEERSVNIDGAKFVSKEEYDQFVAKVSAALEALNGVHATVPATAARNTANGTQGTDVNAEADDARRPLGAH